MSRQRRFGFVACLPFAAMTSVVTAQVRTSAFCLENAFSSLNEDLTEAAVGIRSLRNRQHVHRLHGVRQTHDLERRRRRNDGSTCSVTVVQHHGGDVRSEGQDTVARRVADIDLHH